MQAKRPLAEGDLVNLTLRFDDGSTQAVSMPVRKAQAMGGHQMHEQGSAHGTTAE
jgi:copper(I)-binding protein